MAGGGGGAGGGGSSSTGDGQFQDGTEIDTGKIGSEGAYEVGGMRFLNWKQFPLDGSEGEGWESWLHHNGCGLTSAAILLSAKDSKYTPYYLYTNYRKRDGYVNIKKMLTDAGCKVSSLNSTSGMVNDLRNGKKVIFNIRPGTKVDGQTWTKSGHYMAVLDVSADGKRIYISNPGASNRHRNGWYDISKFEKYINWGHTCSVKVK